jgi:predicted membrane protein
MKHKFVSVILIALVLLQILDGDFTHPSVLDYFKFVLLAVALALSIITQRKKV